MHEFLHIIGLCADSFTHIDLFDILCNYYSTNPLNFNINIKQVFKNIWKKIEKT